MQTRVCRLYGEHDIRIETDTVGTPGEGEVLVAIGAGGICGSDLHYYHEGGFGPIRVKEPIILGHEIAGTVEAVGPGVTAVKAGDRVALNPSRPCGHCKYCREGMFNHCLEMRFYGSALRFPHEQGAFRDRIVAQAFQCEPIGEGTSIAEAACSEPLSVCVHAANRAGELQGKRVLVTGAGPIGALCAAVARQRGATEIVVTDLQGAALAVATEMGATRTVNVSTSADVMEAYAADKGYFDVVFECSAAPAALRTAIASVRPQGIIVQVGVTGDLPVPINVLVGKEIEFKGTHRFHSEFGEAVQLIDTGAIDVKPIITATYPLERALEAFDAAGDRTRSVKVHLAFA
ncbi:alcohol dehydrogenase catalytic domain-containing protein [Stappia sp. GBMRC 2046]|uniref:Alcohol dehydrogenase catalytic domain-containing protein n=1 Tax=Stappia sediminis TaxID=2692190 RepID=A0A7X3S8Z6_9HYPH|nr:L-idonate 5-dehydrogenase [Stappia sediminis]MXN66332.1 alcohol dehydrogenase catalytic domain-containing protein [Stappia sediminis]